MTQPTFNPSSWIQQYCASTAATTTTATWYNNYQTQTASTSTYAQPFQQAFSSFPSAAQIISSLESDGYKVLQKKSYVVNRGVPMWGAIARGQVVDIPLSKTMFGFALPESEGEYLMPDGSTLHVDQFGNYQILDQDAKVTYKANRIREFNPFISASDLLESFIKEVGRLDGVNQNEILRLPIEAFINWLILQAAKKDGDSLEGLPSVEAALPRLPPPPPAKPRCLGCGQFMSRVWAATRVSFCSQAHWNRYQQKRLSYG